MCKFKVYNVMILYMYKLWKDYHKRLVNTSIPSHNYHFVCVCGDNFYELFS